MGWHTVYDFGDQSFRWQTIIGIPILILLGFAIAAWKSYRFPKFRNHNRIVSWLLCGFLCLFGALVIPAEIIAYNRPREIYDSGKYAVVEGIVTDFQPMPSGGHQHETFSVQGIKFEYSDFDQRYYGFNNTKSHGGPIDANKTVRLSYYPDGDTNVILKVEIQE
jgi:hypothetical protein